MSADKLVMMANQMAANNEVFGEAAAIANLREHIHSFWTPVMIAELTGDPAAMARLNPLVVAALSGS